MCDFTLGIFWLHFTVVCEHQSEFKYSNKLYVQILCIRGSEDDLWLTTHSFQLARWQTCARFSNLQIQLSFVKLSFFHLVLLKK